VSDVRVQTLDAIGATSRKWRAAVDRRMLIAARDITRGSARLTRFQNGIVCKALSSGGQGSAGFLPANAFDQDRAREPEQRWKRRVVVEHRMVLDDRWDPEMAPVGVGPLPTRLPA
jgi:hypothetical protein